MYFATNHFSKLKLIVSVDKCTRGIANLSLCLLAIKDHLMHSNSSSTEGAYNKF